MKRFSIPLDARQVEKFFSPIRTKKQIIELLMQTIKLFLINQPLPPTNVVGEVVLIVSKMSRFFYFKDGKYFSLNCPFFVMEDDSIPQFWCGQFEVDNKTTSDVIGVIKDGGAYDATNIYGFLDPIADLDEEHGLFWGLIINLLTFDDGYIRYDDDITNVNGRLHPQNHYDVFYSNQVTFKIGLNRPIGRNELIDLVSIETDCHFLK